MKFAYLVPTFSGEHSVGSKAGLGKQRTSTEFIQSLSLIPLSPQSTVSYPNWSPML